MNDIVIDIDIQTKENQTIDTKQNHTNHNNWDLISKIFM